jgi:hypothetical protein
MLDREPRQRFPLLSIIEEEVVGISWFPTPHLPPPPPPSLLGDLDLDLDL